MSRTPISGQAHKPIRGDQTRKDAVTRFFAELAAAGHVPTFERNSATLRFDVTGNGPANGDGDRDAIERWYVTVANGDVAVSRKSGPADAVVRIQRRYLAALVTGRTNAQAAYLRGLLTCEGSMAAVMMFQRCLPGPPGSSGRVAPITSAAVTATQAMTGRRSG